MLKSLPFEGTIKVRNKGVDIALLADCDTIETAFAASRKLAVCGISTAVLEITSFDAIDTCTLAYYEQTTICLLAMNHTVFTAVRPYIAEKTYLRVFQGTGEPALIDTVRKMIKEGNVKNRNDL